MVKSPTNRSSMLLDQSRHEAIAARAYQLWEESGYVHGHHHEHWRQAEQEIGGDGNGISTMASVTQMKGQHRDGVSDFPSQEIAPKVSHHIPLP